MVFAGKPIKLILSTAGTGEIWENLEAVEKTSYELKNSEEIRLRLWTFRANLDRVACGERNFTSSIFLFR